MRQIKTIIYDNQIYMNKHLSSYDDIEQDIIHNTVKSFVDEKIHDVNFSVMFDRKTLEHVSTNTVVERTLPVIYPKINKLWVDSTLITNCQKCNLIFTLYYRKHHCRACGCVFCYSCCKQYINIPKDLIDIPKESPYWSINIVSNKSLVCDECYNKIDNLIKVEIWIGVAGWLDLDTLYNTSVVSKSWRITSIYYLSKFRNIQYLPPKTQYNSWECGILWSLKDNSNRHNELMMSIVKCIIQQYHKSHNPNQINELIEIIRTNNDKNKRVPHECWKMMCSRRCDNNFDVLDFIGIIEYLSIYDIYHVMFWTDENIIKLITTLVTCMQSNSNNVKSLMPCISKSFRILMNVEYNIINKEFYRTIMDVVIKDNIFALNMELKYLEHAPFTRGIYNYIMVTNEYISKYGISGVNHMINNILLIMNTCESKDVILPMIYPFDPSYKITKINNVTKINSYTRPLLVDMVIETEKTNIKKHVKFIIKHDMMIRKEQIVACLIKILQNKLVSQSRKGRIEKFKEIPTYDIVVIKNDVGIIEYVDNSKTLRNISMDGYTLHNYILEHNENIHLKEIKNRIITSLAISSSISYILGLGDRHLDNIMMNKMGQIFHIDYCHIMENPKTNILGEPVIKITREMMDLLGGVNSKYYIKFKNYILAVFDVLRLYKQLVFSYYDILDHETLISVTNFCQKLDARFMTGMSCKEAEIMLINEIENSSSGYTGAIVDSCHHYKTVLANKLNDWI